jgi:hypothetical protein|tara:strand:- start:1049 stop:1204 length:156 start_codon:yes stop_codon:yes gene_type:complete
MILRKQIQQDGDSLKLRITKKEAELYGWKVNDIVDLSDIVLIKKEKTKDEI